VSETHLYAVERRVSSKTLALLLLLRWKSSSSLSIVLGDHDVCHKEDFVRMMSRNLEKLLLDLLRGHTYLVSDAVTTLHHCHRYHYQGTSDPKVMVSD
jgi:hypothetical protein